MRSALSRNTDPESLVRAIMGCTVLVPSVCCGRPSVAGHPDCSADGGGT
jgi:hypothetical protein